LPNEIPTDLRLESVTPYDCALALTIPLSRRQFLDDLSKSEKDFAAHIRRSNLQDSVDNEYYWNTVYGPLCKVVERICCEVHELGVTVEKNVTAADLSELLSRFKVVTFVSHWRFTNLGPDDVLDIYGLLDRLRDPENVVQSAVSRAFIDRCPELLDAKVVQTLSVDLLRQKFLGIARQIIRDAHALYRNNDDKSAPAETIEVLPNRQLERLTRVAFEQAYAGQIRAGKAIEFSDELHTVGELVAAIPKNFSGVLDLTVCNSVIVGKVIKSYYPDCQVAVNRYPTELHVRMGFYKFSIISLHKRPAPFLDVLSNIHTRKF